MAIPGADRFLNCVLNRSKKDIILKILVLLLVVLGTPAYMLNGIVSYQLGTGEFDLSQFFNVVLFMCVVAAYVMYSIVKSLVQHKERDVEWMSALIEYASYFGGDTQKLSDIRDDLQGLVTRNYQRGAFTLFVAISVAVVIQAVLDMLWLIQFDQLGMEVFDMAFIFVILSTICLIVHDRISMIDVLQYRFTLVFSKLMNDEDHHLDPMPKIVWRSKPLRHMFLMMATLGFYSIPYALWTVHQMNLHIKRQWTYERAALEWMARRDGAVAVEKLETVTRKGILHNLKRVI